MIFCCRYCKPPKRYPGCHSHCEEYKKQKEEYLKRVEKKQKEDKIAAGIYENIWKSINKYKKGRRRR